MIRRRQLLVAGAAAMAGAGWGGWLGGPAWAQNAPDLGTPTLPENGVRRIPLGDAELLAVHDGIARRPLAEGFVRNASITQVKAALVEAELPTDYLDVSFTAFLLVTKTRRILMDTGNGEFGAPTTGRLLANLARAGISPDSIDWDVHHGNGTQAAFYDEPRVLTISIHQDRLFPVDDGFREQTGEGKAAGTNLNVPLPAGCGADTYCEVYDRIVIPALRAFQPEVIIVPCGFDAGMLDPLGRMMLHSEGYRRLTRKIMKIADELCGGRLVFTHEGGYNRTNLPFYGLAVMEELSGIKTDVVDPYLEWHLAIGGQEMAPHHEAAIQAAEKNVAKVPKPL